MTENLFLPAGRKDVVCVCVCACESLGSFTLFNSNIILFV